MKFARHVFVVLAALAAVGSGCGSGGSGGSTGSPQASDDPGVPPGPGFNTATLLIEASRDTTEAHSLLSLDAVTGELGFLPGSPTSVAASPVTTSSRPIGLDPVGDRLYVCLCNSGGDSGSIDGFAIDRTAGTLTRLPGAPFRFPGLADFQHLAAHPSGRYLAADLQLPPAVALLEVNLDGSLSPREWHSLHGGASGPRGLAWSGDGRYLYVADDRADSGDDGVYVYEMVSGALRLNTPGRFLLPGGPIDVVVAPMTVTPQ